MPLYEYACTDGHVSERYCAVDDRHAPMQCAKCGGAAKKVISRVGFTMPDIKGYKSVIDGEWIGSRSAHKQHMLKHGVIEIGNEKIQERKPIPLPSVKPDLIRAIG